MVSLSPLCVFEEQARMKCKTSQCAATRRILVIAKLHYQGPALVCVRADAHVKWLMCVRESVHSYVFAGNVSD